MAEHQVASWVDKPSRHSHLHDFVSHYSFFKDLLGLRVQARPECSQAAEKRLAATRACKLLIIGPSAS
jgi:hypothetical protein